MAVSQGLYTVLCTFGVLQTSTKNPKDEREGVGEKGDTHCFSFLHLVCRLLLPFLSNLDESGCWAETFLSRIY